MLATHRFLYVVIFLCGPTLDPIVIIRKATSVNHQIKLINLISLLLELTFLFDVDTVRCVVDDIEMAEVCAVNCCLIYEQRLPVSKPASSKGIIYDR